MQLLGPVLKGKKLAFHFLRFPTGWDAAVTAGAGVAVLDHVRKGHTPGVAERPAGRSPDG